MAELRTVRAPVLLITGEDRLERVVPVSRTREYLALWPQARAVTLANTGHLGSITRPVAFADIVATFFASTDLSHRDDRPDSTCRSGPADRGLPEHSRRRIV
jgi:hypothetical protein